MNNQDLNSLIQQIRKLSPIEQQLLIKSITAGSHEPLTDKEKQFIEVSEKHINKLQEANKKLDEVISKFG